MTKGYCFLPLKANKYSLSENKENRGFSDSIMWGPVQSAETPFLKGTFYGVLFIWGRVKKFFNKTKYFRFICVYISERAEKAYPAALVTPVSLRQGRSSHKCETLSLF